MNAIDERTVRAALRAHRPDPRAFREEVLRKIAARTAPAGRPERAAAAWLPLQLTQSKPGALLTLPVLALAVLALTFVGAMRSVLRRTRRTRPERALTEAESDAALRDWWRRHALHAGVSLVLLGALARFQPAQALVAVLVVSMVAVAHGCGRLADTGAASRATVGKLTTGFLGALLVAILGLGDFAAGQRTFTAADQWIPFALLIGLLLCDLLQRWRARWSSARKAATVLVPSALALGGAAWIRAELRPVPLERALEWASEFERPLDDVVNWIRLAAIGECAARPSGLPVAAVMELPSAARVLEDAWRASGPALLADTRLQPALDAAGRLDLLPEAAWRALRSDPETQRLLAPDAALGFPGVSGLRVRALARGGLTDGQRDRLATALERGWPSVEAPDALRRMALLTELAQHLGRPLSREAFGADVRRVLLAHWMPLDGRADGPAAFAPSPAEAAQGRGSARTPALFLVPTTRLAATLIEAYGAPAAIAPARVAEFLRRSATPSLVEALAPRSWSSLATQPYRYEASASAHALRALAAPRTGSWLRETTLLGTLLLVALCVVATLRARPDAERP